MRWLAIILAIGISGFANFAFQQQAAAQTNRTSPSSSSAAASSPLEKSSPQNQLLDTLLPQLVQPDSLRIDDDSIEKRALRDTLMAGTPVEDEASNPLDYALGGPKQWTSPEGLSSSLQILLLLTVLSLAPAVLLMTTCYVRIIVVLGLLRQAIGLPTLPPAQVMTSIALFMTLFVMTPVWNEVYNEAIQPYTDPTIKMSGSEAWEAGVLPIRRFMASQIDAANNHADVEMFFAYAYPDAELPETFGDVPLRVLLPAFMLSELKTAFLMGFRIFLPFLIVDLVVASVTISMGMLMLPPSVIALPFKLLLFILVDGWHLVVEMLLVSFGTLPVS